MKYLIAVLSFVFIGLLHLPAAHATDFVFSSFQCDPLSCINRTPFPVFQGSASVSFDGTCTGGAVAGGIHLLASAVIGIPIPCSTPYTPEAKASKQTIELLDDFGCEYSVDTVLNVVTVYDAFGINVF